VLYQTAGAFPDFVDYANSRETGIRKVYEDLLGFNSWVDKPLQIRTESGELKIHSVSSPRGRIRLMFLQRPNGPQDGAATSPSLPQLFDGRLAKLPSVYKDSGGKDMSRADLMTTLVQVMKSKRWASIHVLDPSDVSYVEWGFHNDHADHQASARFAVEAARTAFASAANPPPVTHHRGYNVAREAINVTGPILTHKIHAIKDVYGPHDSALCSDHTANCIDEPDSFWLTWINREYVQACSALGEYRLPFCKS
jgi:hypothetical protein